LVESTACGVGEIGLDRNRQPFDKQAQEHAFRAQLEVARRHRRPAMIHCVRSWGWMMDVLRSEDSLPQGFLMHAYGGSSDLIPELVDMGAYISFSGKVLEPNYERARVALKAMPLDRLLLETDGPCLIPPPRYRAYELRNAEGEEENHPANLALILEGVAELLGERADTLKTRLWENAQRFMGPLLDANKEQK
jgi:TatD DNase family protein